MFEQKFAFSLIVLKKLFFVLMRKFHLDFHRFFWIGFFLNGFPNPFIVHFRSSFLFRTKLSFLASGVLFTCDILTLFFFSHFLI